MLAIFLSMLCVLLTNEALVSSQTVDTTIGVVQGFQSTGVLQFLGIPFAESPTGNRRFAKPVWKTRMPGTYNATYFRSSCPQNQIDLIRNDTDEDCLFLNIFSPINATIANPKTVMVWVHGGAYIQGSGVDRLGSLLALRGDVIVVTINYRLGALGFFSTGDENAVGNSGLWDQTMALQWIKVNIRSFGGNPEKVTIFGESAGSSSVTQLAISPFAQNLFQGVIAESGTASAEWSHYDDPLTPARQLGRRLGCPTGSNKALVECMRTISVDKILSSQVLLAQNPAFLPIYGSDFLPYSPLQLTTTHVNTTVAKRLAELDFIIGQNSDEGSLFFKFSLNPILEKGEVIDDVKGIPQTLYDRALIHSIRTIFHNNNDLAYELIQPLKFMYTDWGHRDDGVSRARSLIKLFSDATFTVSIVTFARSHALLRQHWAPLTTVGGTYVYLFDHRGSWSEEKQPWRSGADHTDEIPFVFGYLWTGKRPAMTDDEETLSVRVMKYWSNFAKTGNPNQPPGGTGLVPWPMYEGDTQKYLRLDTDLTDKSVQSYVFNERVEFWLTYLPKQIELFQSEPKPSVC